MHTLYYTTWVSNSHFTLRASPDLIELPTLFIFHLLFILKVIILRVIFEVVIRPSEWKDNLNVQKHVHGLNK